MLPLLLIWAAEPSIASIDALAKARDVGGLTQLLAPLPKGEKNPLGVLKTGGAYEVGKYGWHAVETAAPQGAERYVVLTTPLTSEDIGELVFRREGAKLAYVPESDDLGVRVVRHDVALTLDVPKKQAAAEDSLTLVSRQPAGKSFLFRLAPEYKVGAIEDAAHHAVPFAQAGGVVFVRTPEPGRFTWHIRYQGTVNLPLYAGSISDHEATLANDYWYPMIARRPAPYAVTVTAPKGWTIVGQGRRTRDEETADGHVAHFEMDLPVVYYSLSAGPYKTVGEAIDGRTFFMWSPRVPEDRMRLQPKLYAPILKFYEQSFGKFPFESYGALDSPSYGGGALEAYSYATYGGGLPDEDAHEPSHTWWGGILPNTYLRSFWNESFAVFSDGLYRRNVPIGNVAERRLAFVTDPNASPEFDEASCADGGADVGPVASSLGYGKGAFVLQMLEQILGTDTTIATMRRWVEEHPKGEPAEWEEYEKVAQEVAPDAHLDTFFHDWLHRPGYARLRVDHVGYAGHMVTFTPTFEGPSFDMPLDVMLQFPDGRRAFQTVRIGSGEAVRIPADPKPSLVSIDPWRRALRDQRPDETPAELRGVLDGFRQYVDPAHPDYLLQIRGAPLETLPADLNGVFLIGSPETLPAMRPLCEKAGFQVQGDRLTYDGTTLDLNHGTALALVDLGGGKRCAIGLGKSLLAPRYGRARLALTDELGRFLRGKTEPKTEGFLTFKL